MTPDAMLLFTRRSKTACAINKYDDAPEIYRRIDTLVNDGTTHFLFNADTVEGLDAAQQVLLRKKKQKGNISDKIILIAVTCNENAIADRSEDFRDRYFDIISCCDDFIDLKNNTPGACEKFMLSKSGQII